VPADVITRIDRPAARRRGRRHASFPAPLPEPIEIIRVAATPPRPAGDLRPFTLRTLLAQARTPLERYVPTCTSGGSHRPPVAALELTRDARGRRPYTRNNRLEPAPAVAFGRKAVEPRGAVPPGAQQVGGERRPRRRNTQGFVAAANRGVMPPTLPGLAIGTGGGLAPRRSSGAWPRGGRVPTLRTASTTPSRMRPPTSTGLGRPPSACAAAARSPRARQ